MTKPHTTLSEAVRALELPKTEYMGDDVSGSPAYGYTAEQVRALIDTIAALVEQHEAQEPVAPAILEALSYHGRERDDMTLEEAISVIRHGWRQVSGRTERAMVLQIAALLSAQPTLAATQAANPNVISIGHGVTLQRQTKTTGAVGWLMYNEHWLVRSLDAFETQLVESALATMSPTTTRSE